MSILDPRWTKPAIVLTGAGLQRLRPPEPSRAQSSRPHRSDVGRAGGGFRLVCENAPDAPVEVRLRRCGIEIALGVGTRTISPGIESGTGGAGRKLPGIESAAGNPERGGAGRKLPGIESAAGNPERGGAGRKLPGGRCVGFDCKVPDVPQEGLYDLRVIAGGHSAVARNSVCVLHRFKDPFVFLHTSDLHLIVRRPDGRLEDRAAVAEGLVDAINSLRPEFVVNTGDLVSRYGENAHDILPPDSVRRQIERAREIMLSVRVPTFVTPGNHDAAFEWCREAWAEHMGGPWDRETDDYSFDYGEYHFAALEACARYDERTHEPTRMGFSPEQLAWLEEDMRRAAGKRLRFLFYHYDYGRQLLPFLRELHVDMVLYGHSGPTRYAGATESAFVDGHLEGSCAYQLIRVEKGKISVEAGPPCRELGERQA